MSILVKKKPKPYKPSKNLKVHWRLSGNVGACGYSGKTTRDKNEVTCKICKQMVKNKAKGTGL